MVESAVVNEEALEVATVDDAAALVEKTEDVLVNSEKKDDVDQSSSPDDIVPNSVPEQEESDKAKEEIDEMGNASASKEEMPVDQNIPIEAEDAASECKAVPPSQDAKAKMDKLHVSTSNNAPRGCMSFFSPDYSLCRGTTTVKEVDSQVWHDLESDETTSKESKEMKMNEEATDESTMQMGNNVAAQEMDQSDSTASPRRSKEFSSLKSIASSPLSAIANVPARSKSRGPSGEKSKDLQEVTSNEDECAVLEEHGVGMDSIQSTSNLKEDAAMDEKGSSAPSLNEDTIAPSKMTKAKQLHVNTDAPAIQTDALPKSPMSPTKDTFMGRFFSGLFCKTEGYLGDFSTLCGGTTPLASPAAIEIKKTPPVQCVLDSPSATNAVEVTPIFDGPAAVAAPSVDEDEPVLDTTARFLTPIESSNSIDLQNSSLRSTKSNKSLKLITEVAAEPLNESSIGVASPEPNDDSTSTVSDVSKPEASNGTENTKSNKKKMDLRIQTSFLKKQEETEAADDIGDERKSLSTSFNLTKSLKAGLDNLSPKSVFKGFKKSASKSHRAACQSPSAMQHSSPKPARPNPDLEGIRIYGGGISNPVEEQNQYPKFSLDYKRKKGGLHGIKREMNKRVSQMRVTAMSMNKVLQQNIVKASQPKVKAIMTNHVYKPSQPTNQLY